MRAIMPVSLFAPPTGALLLALALLFFNASPASGRDAPLALSQPATQPASGAAVGPASDAEDYQLGVADKVRIIVFDEPTLSG